MVSEESQQENNNLGKHSHTHTHIHIAARSRKRVNRCRTVQFKSLHSAFARVAESDSGSRPLHLTAHIWAIGVADSVLDCQDVVRMDDQLTKEAVDG